MSNNLSIVEYFGPSDDGKCGYCKKTGNYVSAGFWAHSLTAQDYQDLINRNWRRSGQYCYQPQNKNTCCVMYTIKCDAINFRMTKSQKKIIKRMNAFLKDGTKSKGSRSGNDKAIDGHAEDMGAKKSEQSIDVDKVDMQSVMETEKVDSGIDLKTSDAPTEDHNMSNAASVESKKNSRPMKKKVMRIDRLKKKLEAKGLTLADAKKRKVKNAPKSVEELLSMQPKDGKHKLEVKLVQSEDHDASTYPLFVKYQQKIHNDPPEKNSIKSFERFLVTSPMKFQRDNNSPSCGFGSFHHQYYLDGVLIAVGVIDILPECVSSVYFYYDPDFDFLSLGTYASLQEIALARELSKTCASLKNYYLGFYIPTCPKMRYKSGMKPSYLLCPESYTWKLLDAELSNEIDKVRYLKINASEEDRNKVTENELQYVLVLFKSSVMKYKDFRRLAKKMKNDHDEVLAYANLVGKALSQRIVLYRS